LTALLLTARVT